MRSAKKDGWRQHDGLEFLIDDELPESLTRLSRDSMILAKLNTGNGLGVAQVLEVLEVRTIDFSPLALLAPPLRPRDAMPAFAHAYMPPCV